MPSIDPGIVWAAAVSLAFIFVWAGIGKLRTLDEFTGVVANYRLLPHVWATPVARAVPAVEIAAGLGLLVPGLRPFAAAVVFALLVAFTAALAINLLRGRTYIDCGCFRLAARRPLSWNLVARNAVMMGLTALIWLGPGARALVWLDAVTIVGAAAALTLLYIAVPYMTVPTFDIDESGTAQMQGGGHD